MLHCSKCADPGLPYDGPIRGSIQQITSAGEVTVSAYVTGNDVDRLILFASDIFGYMAPTAQKVADYLAYEGEFRVVIPDLFKGDPLPFNTTREDLGKIFPEWLKRHDINYSIKLIHDFVEIYKNRYVEISVIGFCWGALPVLKQLTRKDIPNSIKNGFIAHPSRVHDYSDYINLLRPLYIAAAEHDQAFPLELVRKWKSDKPDFISVSEHPGCQHGFVTRPSNSTELQEQTKALKVAVKFLRS